MASRWRYIRLRRGKFLDYPITQAVAATAPGYVPQWITATDRRPARVRRAAFLSVASGATTAPTRPTRRPRGTPPTRPGEFFGTAPAGFQSPTPFGARGTVRRTPPRPGRFFVAVVTSGPTVVPQTIRSLPRRARTTPPSPSGTFLAAPTASGTPAPSALQRHHARPTIRRAGRFTWTPPTVAESVPAPDWAPDFRTRRRPVPLQPRGRFQWAFNPAECSCTTPRPDTGTTGRISAGATTRPFAGVTERTCSC